MAINILSASSARRRLNDRSLSEPYNSNIFGGLLSNGLP
jgi:hypothetical protein